MERTGQNIQLSRLKKPNKTKDLLRGEYRIAYLISSQDRYDHFDTAPIFTGVLYSSGERKSTFWEDI